MACFGVTAEEAERLALESLGERVSQNGWSRGMAQQEKSSEVVTLQELAVSRAYEIAALGAVLERKGILTQGEALEEITRLREQSVKGRWRHHERRGEPRRSPLRGRNVLLLGRLRRPRLRGDD